MKRSLRIFAWHHHPSVHTVTVWVQHMLLKALPSLLLYVFISVAAMLAHVCLTSCFPACTWCQLLQNCVHLTSIWTASFFLSCLTSIINACILPVPCFPFYHVYYVILHYLAKFPHLKYGSVFKSFNLAIYFIKLSQVTIKLALVLWNGQKPAVFDSWV